MNALVVGFDGNGINDLEIEGDGDTARFAVWMCEEAVVVTTAATEARSITSESEAGDEDEIERGDFDGRTVLFGLPDVHLAALEIIERADMARLQLRGFNLEEA